MPPPACMLSTAGGSSGGALAAVPSSEAGISGRPALDPSVRHYLMVLLAIAAANSAITLVRAFSFAKGGLVAAQVRRACWERGGARERDTGTGELQAAAAAALAARLGR